MDRPDSDPTTTTPHSCAPNAWASLDNREGRLMVRLHTESEGRRRRTNLTPEEARQLGRLLLAMAYTAEGEG